MYMSLSFLICLVTALVVAMMVNPSSTLGFLVSKTPQQIYNQSDVIVIGTLISAVGRPSERSTDYAVAVEKYLKNDLHQGTLQINGIGKKNSTVMSEDEPIFSKGQRVVLYLTSHGSEYNITPYSHVLVYGKSATRAIQQTK
jgi:hypothetical protein